MLLAMRFPSIQRRVDSEMGQARKDIEAKLVAKELSHMRHLTLPLEGQTPEWIRTEMERMDSATGSNEHWKSGKLSGAVYHGGDDLEVCLARVIWRD